MPLCIDTLLLVFRGAFQNDLAGFKAFACITADDHHFFGFEHVGRHGLVVLHPLFFAGVVYQDERERYPVGAFFNPYELFCGPCILPNTL